MATADFTKNEWKSGDVLTADKLNNTDNGVANAIAGVQALESATAEATALEAGQQPTANWDGEKWTFGIPAGEKGDQGPAGANGKNGSCFRVSATALTDSQSGIAADALTPNNSTIPYAVGDIVMDGTTKKIFEITNVSEGTATIGAALVTLP